MVLPIIIGVGITVRSTLNALRKYQNLSAFQIALLNGIKPTVTPHKYNLRIDETLRQQFQRYPGGFNTVMTEGEALDILNIKGEEIMRLDSNLLKKKHRNAMIWNHPDKGGSRYLAMKCNEAKDVLEKGYLLKGRKNYDD
ncbi:hypothetical protein WICPIJ_001788 [Wickerhamomyces pijperi]|uniref:J domain-containing protein n=1 Tax=Wickerhamomyces pijperi TaxID=599730 RepID=A0A9P8TQT4_WICPI|nr:hypothetical protein WICPIJ_001788 [Wickerhamomyces pijperi]